MIGRTLSHYKVLEEISRGGMGIVYKALDLKLNREVVIEIIVSHVQGWSRSRVSTDEFSRSVALPFTGASGS